MAYQSVPFPMTLNDLKGNSPAARSFQMQLDEHFLNILHGFN